VEVDEVRPTRGLTELAYYYPEPYWLAEEGSWIKSLLLFFDGVAILLPDYMKGRELLTDPSLAGPLTDLGLLRILEPEWFVDEQLSVRVAESMVELIVGGAFDNQTAANGEFATLSMSRMGSAALSESRMGSRHRGVFEMIHDDLMSRGLALESNDGVSIPLRRDVRLAYLLLLAQEARDAGRRHGFDLHRAPGRANRGPAAIVNHSGGGGSGGGQTYEIGPISKGGGHARDIDITRGSPAGQMSSSVSVDASTPEIGRLVEVRGRHWVVTESIPSALPPDVLGGESSRQHLLTLSSVEDDGLGDELRVVWEAEVGRHIRHQATLPEVTPDGFDDPDTLAAFLDAVSWGAVTSAEKNTLQAPFRSGITIEEYQLEPLVRALGQPRVNLLIADDVGLGKTIEAGLVVQELLLRHRIRRVMVVCPATLTHKWKGEMIEKFGLDFTIVDSECLRQLRRSHGINANPFRVFPLTIVSLPWLPGPRAERILSEVLPRTPTYPKTFDLLIVDEAHHVAPKAAKATYAVDSQQTRAMRRLAQHFEHRLFLSATPHNGYRESWTALLAMLDPLRFARGVEPDDAAKRQVVVRRMKDSIRRPDGSPRFPKRVVEAIEVEYSETDREAHRLLQAFMDSRRKRVESNSRRRSAVDIATLLLKKRLFSSPIAFAKTIDHYAGTLRRKRREQDNAESPPTHAPAWLQQLELAGQEEADDEAKTEAEHDQLARTTEFEAVLTANEDRILRDLLSWARQNGDRIDAKARRLLDLIESTCRPAGRWNDERIVIFTEYRDTQVWLADLLQARGLGGQQLELLYGGQDEDERERIKNAFQAPPDRAPVRILLATDCAGEGIDLQLQCHRVVNYDIPFNPNRLEQRIGRIDRHGQQFAPEVTHFVGAGWQSAPPGSYERDLEFLARVARKVAAQSEDLGEINSILEKAIQRHMVGDSFGIEPDAVTSTASALAIRAERDLRERIEELGQRLQESIDELRIRPANLERVTRTALSLARQPALITSQNGVRGLVRLPNLSGSWARASAGIADPLSGEPRPITFDPAVAAGRQDVVLAHLGHPLLTMSTRLLRAAVWGADHGGLNRVSACIATGLDLEATLLVAFTRLVLVGAEGTRLHEEVFPTGGWLRNGHFQALGVNATANLVARILATEKPEPVGEAEHQRLSREWQLARSAMTTSITNRAREREQSLTARMDALRSEETKRLEQAVDQFRRTLQNALNDRGIDALQLTLFDDERDQLRRDVEGWRSTLENLDAQQAEEKRQIEKRYSEVRPLTFPAAILFAVPAEPSR
jgi:superfamily II DNA/RNA helicase